MNTAGLLTTMTDAEIALSPDRVLTWDVPSCTWRKRPGHRVTRRRSQRGGLPGPPLCEESSPAGENKIQAQRKAERARGEGLPMALEASSPSPCLPYLTKLVGVRSSPLATGGV